MRMLKLLIPVLLLCTISARAQSQTSPQAQTLNTAPKTAAAAPVKSKALLAAEKRIADLETQLSASTALGDEARQALGALQGKFDADEAELKPLRRLMANIAATVPQPSGMVSTDSLVRQRAVLMVGRVPNDSEPHIAWFYKGPKGAALADLTAATDTDPTVADVLAKTSIVSFTVGDMLDYDKQYNDALALLIQGHELLDQQNDLIGRLTARVNYDSSLAAQNALAAENAQRQQRFDNYIKMMNMISQQNAANLQAIGALAARPPVVVPRQPINCASTAFGNTINTSCF